MKQLLPFMFLMSCTLLFSCADHEINDIMNPVCIHNANADSEPEALSPPAYLAWVREPANGLYSEQKYGDITYAVQYKPIAYMICLEERCTSISDSLLKVKESELAGMAYYDLKISIEDFQREILNFKPDSDMSYDERLKYFAFEMQKDISLISGSDTIPCEMFHFERTFAVAPYEKFLLGFSVRNTHPANNQRILFKERVFTHRDLSFEFASASIANIPSLITIQ